MARRTHIRSLHRVFAGLQAALFLAGLLVAPLVHSRLCDDVCALSRTASAAQPPCHAHEKGSGGGCQCLGDCCSISACCVTSDIVADAAPPSPLPALAPVLEPQTPRAPGVWLLPYPTGPPASA